MKTNIQNKKRQKTTLMIALALTMPMVFVTTAFADGYTVWLTPFESLINTMITFMGIIGKALLAWAIFEVATALFSHDTSQMPQALRRIGAGTLLIFIQTIITAMSGSGGSSEATEEVTTAMIELVQKTIFM